MLEQECLPSAKGEGGSRKSTSKGFQGAEWIFTSWGPASKPSKIAIHMDMGFCFQILTVHQRVNKLHNTYNLADFAYC